MGSYQRAADLEQALATGQAIAIGKHGHVWLTDVSGDEERIVQAARVSYQKGTKSVSEDAALIDYLLRHKHTSPLEQANVTFSLRLPIAIAAQTLRHRVARLNQESARYSVIEDDFWLPDLEGKGSLRAPSSKNKQAGEVPMDAVDSTPLQAAINQQMRSAFETYHKLLEAGVCREQARMVLPQGTYTRMVWQMDLHNLIHFLRLRDDSHAQWEIQVYGKAIKHLVHPHFPNLFKSAQEHVWGALTLPESVAKALKTIVPKELLEKQLEADKYAAGFGWTLTAGAQREALAHFN